MKRYNPSEIEPKWQKYWHENNFYKAKDFDETKLKYFASEMFPYPSGDGLHVGHVRNFTIVDVLARYKTQKGYNVLRTFGYDTFGLPAENYAIKTGKAPQDVTVENIANFRNQAKKLGFAIDWSRELNTSDPGYYKWTQWIFSQLYKKGLAYKKESYQWWCNFDKTVLANEQVESGRCWRCGKEVEKKKMSQWYFKITEYADELLNDLDKLDWPEKIKVQQRNWIGRSEGELIDFKIDDSEEKIRVFTTRPDTIFGSTFMVLAPEHNLVTKLTTEENQENVIKYRENALKKSEIERQENKQKTGVFTGSYAINPANNQKIPVWIADYVLPDYGEGAIMAVPADDERDRAFANKYDLEIIEKYEYTDKSFGEKKVQYKIRDWLISRQRYWGCPIPIVYDKNGQAHLIPDDQLPVELPRIDDYKPDDSGHSALYKDKDWLKVTINGEEMTRETDTLDGYACSSWYLLRYADPHNKDQAWDKELVDFWNPIDCYVGADHAVAHLLYVRFWCKAFADLDLVDFREPVKKLIYHGYINDEKNKKMSKSKGNVINPLDIINSGYGADTLRTYEMFIAPYEMNAPWSTAGVGGVYRFLTRVWNQTQEFLDKEVDLDEKSANELMQLRHKTIKKVTEDIERNNFNTAVAALMEYSNGLTKIGANKPALVDLVKLLMPFAPHISSELLEQFDESPNGDWPEWDEKYLESKEITIAIQVNGRLRGEVNVENNADESIIKPLALDIENVKNFTDGKEIIKTIFVPNKIMNFVVK